MRCVVSAILISTIGAATTLLALSQEKRKGNSTEIDVAKILWHSHADAEHFFGKPSKILRPRIPAEGWEYQYRNGNGTVGTEKEVLLVLYRFKDKPKDYKEALQKVGLPTDVPPVDFDTSYLWLSQGLVKRPIRVKGRVLNRVILAKDYSEITIDGHKPGTY